MLTDRSSPALLASAGFTAMIAMPTPMLRAHPPLFEPAVLQHDLLVPVDHFNRANLGNTPRPLTFALVSRTTTIVLRATTANRGLDTGLRLDTLPYGDGTTTGIEQLVITTSDRFVMGVDSSALLFAPLA